MSPIITEEELLEIERLWKASSASSRSYSEDVWRVALSPGENWLVASLGCSSEDGNDYYVTTNGVHASELRGDAKADAEFIAAAPRLIRRLAIVCNEMRMRIESLERELNGRGEEKP